MQDFGAAAGYFREKQNTMAKETFKKYIWMLSEIYRSGGLTYKEISDRWKESYLNEFGEGIPKRTFVTYRDNIEEMFGINISCDASSGYKYRIEDDKEFKDNDVVQWLLSSFSVNNRIHESSKLADRIIFEKIPAGNEHLMKILEAMEENRVMSMFYQGFGWTSGKEVKAEPYCLKVFGRRWYMLARDKADGRLKTYPLDRILRLEADKETFEMPKDFRAETHFFDSYGIIVDPEDLDVEDIRLKANAKERDYLRSLPLHHSQKEIEKNDEYSVFALRLRPSRDFMREILSRHDSVEILSPEWVREDMKAYIKDMMKVYGM